MATITVNDTELYYELHGTGPDVLVLNNGVIDLNRIKPLARLGYQEYTAVDNVFKMTRPNN